MLPPVPLRTWKLAVDQILCHLELENINVRNSFHGILDIANDLFIATEILLARVFGELWMGPAVQIPKMDNCLSRPHP